MVIEALQLEVHVDLLSFEKKLLRKIDLCWNLEENSPDTVRLKRRIKFEGRKTGQKLLSQL